jgi:histidine triad (HIT) family protein
VTTSSCVFCAIVAGEAEASLVHADDDVVAFLDIAPVTPGHLLVVPRRHAPGLADLPAELMSKVAAVGQRLAGALRAAGREGELRCEGVNLFLADGAVAFQEVFHLHLHVLPRYAGDPFGLTIGERPRPARAELDRLAGALRWF